MLLSSTPGAGKRNSHAGEGQRDQTAHGINPHLKASSLCAAVAAGGSGGEMRRPLSPPTAPAGQLLPGSDRRLKKRWLNLAKTKLRGKKKTQGCSAPIYSRKPRTRACSLPHLPRPLGFPQLFKFLRWRAARSPRRCIFSPLCAKTERRICKGAADKLLSAALSCLGFF